MHSIFTQHGDQSSVPLPLDQVVILRMSSDPGPCEAVVMGYRQCPILHSDAGGPQAFADIFEMQRRVIGVVFQEIEFLVRQFSCAYWQGIVSRPE